VRVRLQLSWRHLPAPLGVARLSVAASDVPESGSEARCSHRGAGGPQRVDDDGGSTQPEIRKQDCEATGCRGLDSFVVVVVLVLVGHGECRVGERPASHVSDHPYGSVGEKTGVGGGGAPIGRWSAELTRTNVGKMAVLRSSQTNSGSVEAVEGSAGPATKQKTVKNAK